MVLNILMCYPGELALFAKHTVINYVVQMDTVFLYLCVSVLGILDVARRTYSEIIDDMNGYYSC